MVWDSAGIRIIENDEPEWDEDRAWRIADEPRLVIGSHDGEEPYLLFSITSAIMHSDGRIAVTIGSGGEVRVFDAEGGFERRFGSRGTGPGEFQIAHRVREGPDGTFRVWDGYYGRLSVFDSDGTFVESFRLPEGSTWEGSTFLGELEDGTLIQARSPAHLEFSGAPWVVQRTPQFVRRLDPETRQVVDTIARLRAPEIYILEIDGSRTRNRVFFSRSSVRVARADDIVVGDSEAFELRVIRPGGEVATLIRKTHEPVPVSAEAERRERESFLTSSAMPLSATQRTRREMVIRDGPAHETLPAFASLRADREGNLWVENSRFSWDEQVVWTVFRADGRWLGEVETPSGITIHEIGDDYLLATVRDELEVQYLALYDIIKPGGD